MPAAGEEGADIIAVDICEQIETVTSYAIGTREDMKETAELVRNLGRRIVAREANVRDLNAMTNVVSDGVDELGRLDIVVANAGMLATARLGIPRTNGATSSRSTSLVCGTPLRLRSRS